MTAPKTVDDIFASPWLHHDDLRGLDVMLKIKAVEFHNFPVKFGDHNGPKEPRPVLDFGRSKKMILNKTQSLAVAGIAGSESFADWAGVKIVLHPGRAHNGKPTIDVNPPPEYDNGQEV